MNPFNDYPHYHSPKMFINKKNPKKIYNNKRNLCQVLSRCPSIIGTEVGREMRWNGSQNDAYGPFLKEEVMLIERLYENGLKFIRWKIKIHLTLCAPGSILWD